MTVNINEFETNDNSFLQAVEDTIAEIKKTEPDEEDEEEENEEIEEEPEDEADDDDDSEDEEDDEDPEDEEEEEPEEEKKPLKSYKATLEDGSQVEVKDNTSIKIKVNGRFKRVTIGDLKEKYNGEIKHEELIRRSSEAEKQAQEKLSRINRETEDIKERTKEISEAITSGNIMGALSTIAEIEGKNPEEVRDAWVNGLTNFIDKFTSQTPEERERSMNKYKLDAELKEKERKLAKLKTSEQEEKAKKAVSAACEKYNISREELQEAHTALKKRNDKLEAEGKTAINFSLNEVVSLALDYQTYHNVNNASEDLDIELDNKEINYIIDIVKAQEKRKGARLKDSEYAKIITKHTDKEFKKLNRKVGAKKKAKTSPKSKKKRHKEITRESQFWDI